MPIFSGEFPETATLRKVEEDGLVPNHFNAPTGHAFLQFWHKMHSVAFFRLRELLLTSTSIGQTFRHLSQWMHFSSSHLTRSSE